MTHTYGASPEAWRHWASTLGLTEHLLPVVSNPGAVISPDSKMAGLGKTPSDYNFRGQARGLAGWTQKATKPVEINRWMDQPDYGICVQSRAVRAIDIDVGNPRRAQRIVNHIERTLPYHFFPQRSRSDSGNTLLAFRFEGSMTKRVIPVVGGMIEFLGDGQQFIAVGTHPKGQRYEWDGGLPAAFPVLDVDDLDILWESLCTAFLEEGKEPRIARERRRIEDMADLPPTDDVVASWLVANWEVHDSGPNEELFIKCPFEAEHTTDTGISSTAYFPAGTGGYVQGHFVCLHAHCQGRGDNDFLAELGWLKDQFEDLTGGVDESEAYHDNQHGGEGGGREGAISDAVAPPTGAVDRPWPRFTRDGKGAIEATARNLKLAIEREDIISRRVAYDQFRDQLVWGPPADPRDEVRWRGFCDEDYVDVRIKLEERGFKPFGKELLRDVVFRVAKGNSIDIAREWLTRLEWDGVPRVERMFADYLHAEDGPYAAAVGRYAMTALAGRVMQPGVQADMAIILHGSQGLLKTSAIRALAPHEEMYTSIRLDKQDDDLARQLRGKLVGELEELRGLNSRQAEEIKAWVSKRVEEWVPKFKEFASAYPRRLVFWGSTNEDEILADSTGERRWLPVTVGVPEVEGGGARQIDIDRLKADRDQLWAEGAVLFAQQGVLWQEAERLARFEHYKFAVVDAWLPAVARWLEEPMFGGQTANGAAPEGVSVTQVAVSALQIPTRAVDRATQMRVSKCLKHLGYFRRQRGREWVYVQSDAS